ncbi:hypothetical protein [Streptomyces bikiniensis]|uniref:hypothetical protein n=1 Tax=Streptomyces bikiniensis TaxID=1896 RepID=UPI00068D7401|nr:hypothetical protein [Streptomyces bikiniensis]
MGSWISVGLGAAAALCPLPQHGGTAVVMDHTPTGDRLVVCAPDVWIDMGHDRSEPRPDAPRPATAPPPACRPPAPAPSAPPPAPRPSVPAPPASQPPAPPSSVPAYEPTVTSPPRPAPPAARHAEPGATAPKTAGPFAESAPAAPTPGPDPAPLPTAAPAPPQAPSKARQAFRWVPRPHYTGGPTRPLPAGMTTTMSTVVVTLPGVLAAVALRPGSRRRGRG